MSAFTEYEKIIVQHIIELSTTERGHSINGFDALLLGCAWSDLKRRLHEIAGGWIANAAMAAERNETERDIALAACADELKREIEGD